MTPDFWRYVALVQAVFVTVLTLGIILRYFFIFKHASSKDKALPIHIICIAASYIILVIATLIELRLRLNHPFTWRIPIFIIAYTIGDIGLIFMLVHLSVQRLLIKAVLTEAAKQVEEELNRKHKETKDILQRIETGVAENKIDIIQTREEIKAITTHE